MKKNLYPKISIITPSFNQGQFIQATIESVLSQNYPNLEYWVIDGGSSDETIKILKSYGEKLQWVSEKDNGQTDALNKGLAKVSGDIIGYINSDDVYVAHTFFEVARLFLKYKRVLWLTGDYQIIDTQGRKIQSFVVLYKRLLRIFLNKTSLGIANSIAQPSTFWHMNAIRRIGMFNVSLKYCMDYDFWLRLISISQPFISKKVFSQFRVHTASKGGSQYLQQFAEESRVLGNYQDNLLILLLHKLHTSVIVLAYRLLK